MAIFLPGPVDIDEAIADAILKGRVVEYACEDEFVCAPTQLEVPNYFGVLRQEVLEVLYGGACESKPVGPADDRIVKGKFPGRDHFIFQHLIGKFLNAVFSGDTPIDKVIFFYAGRCLVPLVFDGFAGDELKAFAFGEVLIDGIGRLEGEVLAGGDVYIIVSFGEDLFEAVERCLDGPIAGPVDAGAIFDEEDIFFAGEKAEWNLIDLFIDVDIEVKSRVVQSFDETFQLLRILMRQDQMRDSH